MNAGDVDNNGGCKAASSYYNLDLVYMQDLMMTSHIEWMLVCGTDGNADWRVRGGNLSVGGVDNNAGCKTAYIKLLYPRLSVCIVIQISLCTPNMLHVCCR